MRAFPLLIVLFSIWVPFYGAAEEPILPLEPRQLQLDNFAQIMESYREVVDFHYTESLAQFPDYPLAELEVGDVAFLPFAVMNPGQPNIDFFNSVKKMIGALEAGTIRWRPRKKGYRMHALEGGGDRVFGQIDCGKGVIVGNKVYLHDGNTHALAALYLGATHSCVEITAKFPNDTLDDPVFRSRLAGQELGQKIFLWNADAERIDARPGWTGADFPSWVTVQDIPMRAILMAHRISVRMTYRPNGKIRDISVNSSDEVDYPSAAFIKINGGPGYIEYLLALAATIGSYSLPIDPASYQRGSRETDYLLRAIRNGMTQNHPLMTELASLTDVPIMRWHGELSDESDLRALLRSHHRGLRRAGTCADRLSQDP